MARPDRGEESDVASLQELHLPEGSLESYLLFVFVTGEFNMKRLFVIIASVVLLTIVFGIVYFVSTAFARTSAAMVATPTPVITIPTPTPTPNPTATPTPLPTPSPTPPPFISGKSAYLIDATTDTVLYSQNSKERLPIASTTKIMTAVLAIENGNLDQHITIQQADLDEVPPGASVAQLQAGDSIRLRNLLYALMLPSGSDAAVVIAHYIGGSTSNFVSMMNNKAQAIGMTNTHYSNPHGFSVDNHYSTAADLVKLARYAMRYDFFDQVVSSQSYVLPASGHNHLYNNWNNTNGLLGTYDGADGVKTGSSLEAGYCLVFSATRNGHHLIGAELHADTYDDLIGDAKRMLDKGFSKV